MPEQPDPTGDGGRNTRGWKFSKAVRDNTSSRQLEYLSKVLNHLEKIGKLGDFVKGNTINTPDLRRIINSKFYKNKKGTSGVSKSAWSQWENNLLNKEFRDPDYQGPQPGKFGKGKAQEASWLSDTINNLSAEQKRKLFRGSAINVGDLRRLWKAGILGEEDQERLRSLLASWGSISGETPVDPETEQPTGGGEGPPGGEHGGGGPLPDEFPGGGPRGEYPSPPEFDPQMWEAMKDWILQTFADPGYDPEILEGMRNTQRAAAQTQIRDMTQNAAERFAERGIADSGIAERGFQSIESGAREGLADNLVAIDVENARAALAAVQQAMQGALGMDAAQLDRFQLELQAELAAFAEMAHNDNVLLQWFQLKLQEHLGQGQLDLQRLYYELAFDQNFWNWYFQYAGLPNIDPTGGTGGGDAFRGGEDIPPIVGPETPARPAGESVLGGGVDEFRVDPDEFIAPTQTLTQPDGGFVSEIIDTFPTMPPDRPAASIRQDDPMRTFFDDMFRF